MSSLLTEQTVVVASGNFVAADIKQEKVILELQSGKYYGLDPIGTRIWQLIQEPVAVESIVAVLLEEYNVERSQCVRDVVRLINDMRTHNLVQIRSDGTIA